MKVSFGSVVPTSGANDADFKTVISANHAAIARKKRSAICRRLKSEHAQEIDIVATVKRVAARHSNPARSPTRRMRWPQSFSDVQPSAVGGDSVHAATGGQKVVPTTPE